MSAPDRRKRAHIWGLRAESVAAIYLMAKGYWILDRRFAVDQGEIDLVARKGEVISFVEVKARETFEVAFDAVTRQKVRRISTAANVWRVRNAWANGLILRGDIVLVAPRRLPRHHEDAYTLRIS